MVDLDKNKIDSERMKVLRGLPIEVKESITGEEARAFLYMEELPESLQSKLEGFMVADED